jgi:putative flippase GtrA
VELFLQFGRFTGVGFISAIGHYGLLIFLVQAIGIGAVVASSAGALLGACINYSLNYRLTFRSTTRHMETIFKFVVVAIVGLLLNTLFMWVGVDLLHVQYLIGQVITTGLILIWSFLCNRFWTFHQRTDRE